MLSATVKDTTRQIFVLPDCNEHLFSSRYERVDLYKPDTIKEICLFNVTERNAPRSTKKSNPVPNALTSHTTKLHRVLYL